MKKPSKIDNFLNRHLKHTYHFLSRISIRLFKDYFDGSSTKRYRNTFRYELELKWIDYYEYHIHLVLMILFTM